MATKTKLKVFSRGRLNKRICDAGMTVQQFTGAMIQAAPPGIRPSKTYIDGLITGRHTRPSCDYALLMAHVLGCTVDDLAEVVK